MALFSKQKYESYKSQGDRKSSQVYVSSADPIFAQTLK